MWVIPAIDLRGGRCVRLRQGDFTRETVFSDDPVAVARRWAQAGAPRLHLVDLDGARLGQPVHSAVIESIVRAVSIPCQLGGGVRSTEALEQAWSWGIHSVVIGTRAFEDPDWFRCQARRFPERLWLGLDVRSGRVAVAGWQRLGGSALEAVAAFAAEPLAGVIVTDIERDGMLQGPGWESIQQIQSVFPGRVVLSGGIARSEDIVRARHMGLAGCIIGRALYDGTLTLTEALTAAAHPLGAVGAGGTHEDDYGQA